MRQCTQNHRSSAHSRKALGRSWRHPITQRPQTKNVRKRRDTSLHSGFLPLTASGNWLSVPSHTQALRLPVATPSHTLLPRRGDALASTVIPGHSSSFFETIRISPSPGGLAWFSSNAPTRTYPKRHEARLLHAPPASWAPLHRSTVPPSAAYVFLNPSTWSNSQQPENLILLSE